MRPIEPPAPPGKPTCTVVVAAYNGAATIGEALESVLAQTRRDFELIVVDDGSTDHTAAAVTPYLSDRRVRLERQANAGPAASRNAAIEVATGRYVSMLDSDDLWLPQYLECMVEALERSPAAGFAFTRAWVLERTTNRIRKVPWCPRARQIGEPSELLNALIEDNFVFNAVTVRREVLREVGSYDPTIVGTEDYALWLKLVAHGYGAAFVPGPLCVCSDRPGSLSHDHRRMLTAHRRTYAKLLASDRLTPDAASRARKRLAASERELQLVTTSARRSPASTARNIVAGATRGWRQRRARLSEPPSEVAAAFPGLGRGRGVESPAEPPTQTGLARVVVRGGAIAGAGYAATQAVSLATYLVLARLLVPSDLGTFAAATVLVGLGLVAGESGMLAALIQRRERVEEAFDSAFVASLAVGLVLTLAGVAAAPLVGLFFHSFRTGEIAAVMAGSVLLRMALITPSARLQRRFSFVRRGLLDPLGTLAFAGGAIAAAAAGLGPWALVIGTYAQLVLDVAAAWGLVRWRPNLQRATVSMWRELARFGRPVFGGNLISRATAETPVVAVGRVLGSGALGQFSYAFRVASQPISAIVDVGAYVLLPALARIAPDDGRFRAGLLRALRWTCAIAFPLGLLLVPLGTPAVVLVFGAKWRAAGHAVMALGVYCAALGLDSIASETWKAAGKPKMLPRMHGLAFALTVLCVGALVPFGLNAVTIGMAFAAIGEGAYAVYGIGQVARIPIRRLLAELWPSAIAATVMAGVLFAGEHGVLHSDRYGLIAGVALLAAETLAGVGLYLGLLCALSPSCRGELAALMRYGRQTKFAQGKAHGRAGPLAAAP